jgi:CubicO group peptidase (beta-lactamase class C family)
MRAFGTANQAGTELTQPYHMFRIASVSKPITSIAIMKLIENGQLSLSDKVFGPGGILNADPYFANANVTDSRVYNITIQNLLEHSLVGTEFADAAGSFVALSLGLWTQRSDWISASRYSNFGRGKSGDQARLD